MDLLLYILARTLITALRLLPLRIVARLGRCVGELAYWCDRRHRRVALRNLQRCFGHVQSPSEIRSLARENFRRIGENFGCALRMVFMSSEALQRHYELAGEENLRDVKGVTATTSRVVAIGHFGNFELYTRLGAALPDFQGATTYRGLAHPLLDRFVQSLRARTGCRFFERRSDAAALKAAMTGGRVLLGLLADQSSGRRGLRTTFLGFPCSTSPAPAIFALRYDAPLFTAICYRTGLARWRIEVGQQIATMVDGRSRSIEAITADVNRAFEEAVRRDPANWFWVHNRWKVVPKRGNNPQPDSLGAGGQEAPSFPIAKNKFSVPAENPRP